MNPFYIPTSSEWYDTDLRGRKRQIKDWMKHSGMSTLDFARAIKKSHKVISGWRKTGKMPYPEFRHMTAWVIEHTATLQEMMENPNLYFNEIRG